MGTGCPLAILKESAGAALALDTGGDRATGEGTVDHVQQLLRLVQQLAREAEHASRSGGRHAFDALEVTAAQYLKLYAELKARGEIE